MYHYLLTGVTVCGVNTLLLTQREACRYTVLEGFVGATIHRTFDNV
jgi:hypothetical protein